MTDPTPALLFRLNQNINAIGAAVEELAIWVEQRGSVETSARVKAHLKTLMDNSDEIADLMVDLVIQKE